MTTTDRTEELYAAARELTTTDLLPRLKALIPDQRTILESNIGSHTKHRYAPIPWNTPAAMLYYEIHADARRYESLLTIRLFQTAKYRGGSDTQVAEAINRLPVLIAHGHAKGLTRLDLDDPTTALLGWPRRIRRILDDTKPGEEPTMRVPGDTRCPYCADPLILGEGWKTLEQNATAICRRCLDAHGHALTWPITERIGKLQHDDLITITTATQRYSVKAARIWKWKQRGRIHPYGEDTTGTALYRVSDILRLAEETDDVAS